MILIFSFLSHLHVAPAWLLFQHILSVLLIVNGSQSCLVTSFFKGKTARRLVLSSASRVYVHCVLIRYYVFQLQFDDLIKILKIRFGVENRGKHWKHVPLG